MKKRILSMITAGAITVSAVPIIPYASAEGPIISYDFEDSLLPELKGGAVITDDGKWGKGLYLDGVDSYALLPESILSSEMTVSAWVKLDKLNTWGRLFDFGEGTSNYFFFAPYSGGASRAEAAGAVSTDTMDSTEDTSKIWVHYAVTVDKNEMKLYKNGVLINSKTGLKQDLSKIKNTLNYIGKSQYSTDAYLAGTIDDFEVYDKVLSQTEIRDMVSEHLDSGDLQSLINAYKIQDHKLILGNKIILDSYLGKDLSLEWTSDSPDIINAETGEVIPSDKLAEVKLTLTARSKDKSLSETYTVYVPGKSESPFKVTVDASDRSKGISDNMWGLFFEDINSSADGGLYAELIQNRSFEFPEALYSWEAENAEINLKTDSPIHENNPQYVQVTSKSGAIISNDGFMGMSVKQDENYDFSMYVKGDYAGKIIAKLVDENGSAIGFKEITPDVTAEWSKINAVIPCSKTTSNAKLQLVFDKGSIDVDMISLFPESTYKNRKNGLRADMVSALEELNPKFLRFPGGCIVEGQTLDVAYNWKDTVGDVACRKQTVNIWNTSAAEPYYMTYGLGFYEYLLLCEDLGMDAIPILNCGMACQVRSGGKTTEAYMTPLDEIDKYVQDAIDFIYFANGTDMNNEWVALRTQMGHPDPFNIKYIGIGNEQYGSEYFKRYEIFAKAIREEFPDMELNLVTTSGTASSGTSNDLAWSWVNANNEYADFMDEHYYETADWFRNHIYRYDNYSRDTAKVFLGEYASKGNAWYNALSEAAYMTGLERNADVVRMASYAPLFAKYGNTQWTAANLIWFDNDGIVKTPNYYVQKLFAGNKGDYSLDTSTEITGYEDDSLSGGIALGTWKTQAEFKDVKVVSADGEVLFEDGFDSQRWIKTNGNWSVNDEVLSQTSEEESCLSYINADWRDYTMTLKAKKTGGNEGFLIGAALKDSDNLFWANIGGWSNTATKMQQVTNGAANTISNVAEQDFVSAATVENDIWYDIQIDVTADSITAYLNGEKVCEYHKKESYGPVCVSSVYEKSSGDVILKLVNLADDEVSVSIILDNAGTILPDAKLTVIAADTSLLNTKDNPDAVRPEEKTLKVASNFSYDAPADSLSVIRISSEQTLYAEDQEGNRISTVSAGTPLKIVSDNSKVLVSSYDSNGILRGVTTANPGDMFSADALTAKVTICSMDGNVFYIDII